MGASNSVEAATEEADGVMQMINRKCNSYVMSVEHTNSVVDVTLEGLRKEIFALIEPLRSSKNLVDLGMEDMASVLQGVEHHANTQKHVIQRLVDVMFGAQSTFEEMADNTMASADVDDIPDVLLDEGIMTDMRLIIENLLHAYEVELQAKDVTVLMTKQRCDELHRLLFKLAEVTVSEMVEATVSEMKDAFIEDIDNMICLNMMTGEFKKAAAAKVCLQSIISKSLIARVSLEALPFSRRVEVEAGQDEIEQFVDDLVRKVQMHHSTENTLHFEELMQLDVEYSDEISDEISDDGSDSSSDDNSTEPENNDEDSDGEENDILTEPRANPPTTSPQTKKTPVKASTTKETPSKTPASVRTARKRKDTSTPIDDEISVSDNRATRARR